MSAVRNENILVEIRAKLNEDKIKLWSLPYYDAASGSNNKEIESLAEIYTVLTKIRKEQCIAALHEFQTNALDRLKARKEFALTGIATLKLGGISEDQTGGRKLLMIKQKLDVMGNELRENIACELDIAPHRIIMLSEGEVIQDNELLNSQGINFNRAIMLIIAPDVPTQDAKSENQIYEKLQNMRENAERLVDDENNYFQTEDKPNAIYLPSDVKKQLITAVVLHETGRVEMNKENFREALICFTEADQEFDGCDPEWLDLIDSYAILNLDIVWCNVCVKIIVPDADRRLILCEQSFLKNYGDNFDRVSGTRKALIMRLHLLQSIVLYHQNRRFEAANKLLVVEAELNRFVNQKVDSGKKQDEVTEETLLEKVLSKINTALVIRVAPHKTTEPGDVKNDPFQYLNHIAITSPYIQQLIDIVLCNSLFNLDDIFDYLYDNLAEGSNINLVEELINNPEILIMAEVLFCSMNLGGSSNSGVADKQIKQEAIVQDDEYQQDLSLVKERSIVNEYKIYLNLPAQ